MSVALTMAGSYSVIASAILGMMSRIGKTHASTSGMKIVEYIELECFIDTENKTSLVAAKAEVYSDIYKRFEFPSIADAIVG